MKYRNGTRTQGFTLIELIVVITIVGLLGVIAAPRFLNLSDDAYQATIEGLSAQLGAGVRLTQTRWIANGATPEAQTDLEGYGGGDLDVNEFGYPIGTNKGNNQGIIAVPNNIGKGNAGCISIWEALLGDQDYILSTTASDNDVADIITRRVRDTNNDQSICYYAMTERGYRGDGSLQPFESTYVVWYNSRTGIVSTTPPPEASL